MARLVLSIESVTSFNVRSSSAVHTGGQCFPIKVNLRWEKQYFPMLPPYFPIPAV